MYVDNILLSLIPQWGTTDVMTTHYALYTKEGGVLCHSSTKTDITTKTVIIKDIDYTYLEKRTTNVTTDTYRQILQTYEQFCVYVDKSEFKEQTRLTSFA